MVTVKPKASLCDGTFHKISGRKQHVPASLGRSSQENSYNELCFAPVIKRQNVIQLHVDTVDNYKIGPKWSPPALSESPLYVGGIPGEESSVNPGVRSLT